MEAWRSPCWTHATPGLARYDAPLKLKLNTHSVGFRGPTSSPTVLTTSRRRGSSSA